LIKRIILDELKNLKNVSEKEIKEAKGYAEGRYILDAEDTHNKADELCFWEQIDKAELEGRYLTNIRKVSKKDILIVSKKYLTRNYTMAVIEQEP